MHTTVHAYCVSQPCVLLCASQEKARLEKLAKQVEERLR
jgi:hypothetical protein